MMPRTWIVACATLLIAGFAVGDEPRAGGGLARNKVEGTWEKSFKDQPELRQVKVINQDHYIWVTYDRTSKYPVATAGGSYTLTGDIYKERAEFGRYGTPQLQEAMGKEQTFKVEVDGDTLTQSGTMTNGIRLREVWTRVK